MKRRSKVKVLPFFIFCTLLVCCFWIVRLFVAPQRRVCVCVWEQPTQAHETYESCVCPVKKRAIRVLVRKSASAVGKGRQMDGAYECLHV